MHSGKHHVLRSAALRLVRSASWGKAVDELWASGARRLVAFGDSLTADPLSWAEILKLGLQLAPATRDVKLVNLGVGGDTTVHLVSRFADVIACDPDILIVLAGTNDARRHGASAARMLVPDRETEHNLVLLSRLVREETSARAVFVKPPPVIEARIRRAPKLRAERVSWLAADVERKAAIVAALEEHVLDSAVALPRPLDRLLRADGLHLTLRGQERLARLVIQGAMAARDGNRH